MDWSQADGADNVGGERVLYLGEMEKLSLKPGDVLVLSCKQPLTKDNADRLREVLKEALPNDTRVLVISDDIKVGVLECAPSA